MKERRLIGNSREVVVLLGMCLLVAMILGAAESGPIRGVDYSVPIGFSFLTPHFDNQTLVIGHVTTQSGQRQSQTYSTAETTGSLDLPPPSVSAPVGSVQPVLEVLSWYLLIPVIFFSGVALAMLLARREGREVFDLGDALGEMERQKSYFDSWPDKLRNAALLRYYLLMAKVCSKEGLGAVPEETPKEFISRVTPALGTDPVESARFADVVDMAHYGAELSEADVRTASAFMDAFTRTIMKRSGIAQA